jgi:hypothetical protein
VAACGDQYEAMPDRVLKSQVLPRMEDNAGRVKDAACREKPKALPDPTDTHVGNRVRMRRLMLDMSQTDLAR